VTGEPLSKAEFDKVLARALALEQSAEQQVGAARGAEIAAELGITSTSWEAAMEELRTASLPEGDRAQLGAWRRPMPLALSTGALGAIWSTLGSRGLDIPGAQVWERLIILLVIGVFVRLGAKHVRHGDFKQYLRETVGYWGGLYLGFGFALGGDGAWLSLLLGAISAAIGVIATRRAPGLEAPLSSP
jgi:hypothetical protein